MKCVHRFERDITFSDGNLPFIPLQLESHGIGNLRKRRADLGSAVNNRARTCLRTRLRTHVCMHTFLFQTHVRNLRDLSSHGRGRCTRVSLTHLVKVHCPKRYHGPHLDKTNSETSALRTGDWGQWPLSDAAAAYAALDVLMALAVYVYVTSDDSESCDKQSHTVGSDGEHVSTTETLLRGILTMPEQNVALNRKDILSAKGASGGAETEMLQKRKRQDGNHHSDFFRMQRNKSMAPPNMGKEHPHGMPDALQGVCVVVSGVLDSFSREDFHQYVTKHGGRVMKSVSKKVTHLVTDHGEAGPSKLKKCMDYGIKVVGEDDILSLVKHSVGA